MSTHAVHPGPDRIADLNGPDPILFDDCNRCAEHAEQPMVGLDDQFSRALWRKMIAVEFDHDGGYRSSAEAQAGRTFYAFAVWLERTHPVAWQLLRNW